MTEEKVVTFEQAKLQQWNIAYHRMIYAKENQKGCQCADCKVHFKAIRAEELRGSLEGAK